MTATGPLRTPAITLDKADYRRMLKPRDGVAVAHLALRALFHASLISLALIVANAGHPLWAVLILLPHFAAWSFLGWAGIGHELFHRSVLSNKGVCTFLFRSFSVLTWSNFGYFEVTHPVHHRCTLAPNDIEGDPNARMSRAQLVASLSFDAPGFVRRLRLLIRNARGIIPGGPATQQMFPPGSSERRKVQRGAQTVLAFHGITVMLAVLARTPFLIVAVNLAPFCLTFFNRTLAALQHFNLAAGRSPQDYVASTRTVLLDPVLEFFYAAMNYHIEHHLFPAIPFYHLKDLHAAVAATQDPIHVETGYWNGLKCLAREGFFMEAR